MTPPVVIDGSSLRLHDVVDVARNGAKVAIAVEAIERAERVRKIVDDIVDSGQVVYGVTTGFGKLSDVAIPADRLAELQLNLVRSHSAGVGPLLPEEETRAMMLLRANVLAKGYSGAQPELAQRLVDLLNAELYPPIPEQGSVGASGDLAPLAHLALALVGEGELRGRNGAGPAARMLREAGLAPVRLAPKDGLSLINGTQAHTGIATLAVTDARIAWETAQVAGASSLEALLGTPAAFDPRIHEVRGQSGQIRAAAMLMSLLEGSEIRESHRHDDPRVQDAYALRCMPQVHGPVDEAIRFAESIIERELNAATDNPLVFGEGEILSGGNFHGQAVALCLDVLAIVLTNLAVMSERRIDRLVNPDLNQGLPPFLTRDAGVSSGFMIAQITAAAIASECKSLAHPASVDSIPTDGGKEDVVPMAMGAAIKVRRIVRNVQHVLAIELLCAMQGIDFRRPLRAGNGVEQAYARVREVVPMLENDRALAPDIAAVARAVADGAFAPSRAARRRPQHEDAKVSGS
jgi:histidine ammonia-lyase